MLNLRQRQRNSNTKLEDSKKDTKSNDSTAVTKDTKEENPSPSADTNTTDLNCEVKAQENSDLHPSDKDNRAEETDKVNDSFDSNKDSIATQAPSDQDQIELAGLWMKSNHSVLFKYDDS